MSASPFKQLEEFDPTSFVDHAIEMEEKDWSGHDRNATAGGSEIGSCARNLVYKKLGLEPDPDFTQDYGALERGHNVEAWFEARLQEGLALGREAGEHDIRLVLSGPNQETLVRGAQSITPDGLLLSEKGMLIAPDGTAHKAMYLEIKSKDPRPFDGLVEPEFGHVQQVRQGMDLLRATRNIDVIWGKIIYINASFYHQQVSFWVEHDQEIADGLRNRAEWLLYEASLDDLPQPEGRMYGTQKECSWCPFFVRCLVHDTGRIPDQALDHEQVMSPDEIADLQDMITRRDELNRTAKIADEERKSIDQQIIQIMLDKQLKAIRASEFSTSVYSQNPPPSYNFKQMEADGIDLDKYRKVGPAGTRIKVIKR